MEYDVAIYRLSAEFYKEYPADQYPEIMRKDERPYTCLLIDAHDDYFICIPFRSHIQHKNAYLFTNTKRSKHSKSGLDYKKTAIIKNPDLIDSQNPAVVDQDEYNEMLTNIEIITKEALSYVDTYIHHVDKTKVLHPQTFIRHYRFSTLPYFHDILGI